MSVRPADRVLSDRSRSRTVASRRVRRGWRRFRYLQTDSGERDLVVERTGHMRRSHAT